MRPWNESKIEENYQKENLIRHIFEDNKNRTGIIILNNVNLCMYVSIYLSLNASTFLHIF